MLNTHVESLQFESVQELHISYEASRKLKSTFTNLRLGNDSSWLETREWLGNTVKHSLPVNIVEAIQRFKTSDEQCALIVRGLPVDNDLCATPYKGYLAPSKTPLANACHIGIYQLAGIEPIAYKTENDGLLFRHVVPAIKGRNEKSSHGSTHTFGHHVDNPDLPLSCEPLNEKSGCPEFLSLMALRSDLSVSSNFILIDSLMAKLSRGVLEELAKPQFSIRRPDSFGQSSSTILPLVVFDDNGVIHCRYDKENTTPMTEKAAAALVMLEAQLKDDSLKQHIVYQPGDLVIIKNQRVLHSREGFSPRDDGADRWLMRLFGMNSLDRIVQAYPKTEHIGQD